jgi:hypothetical protein
MIGIRALVLTTSLVVGASFAVVAGGDAQPSAQPVKNAARGSVAYDSPSLPDCAGRCAAEPNGECFCYERRINGLSALGKQAVACASGCRATYHSDEAALGTCLHDCDVSSAAAGAPR